MKLFGRSSGYYLFWTGFVYFWVGMYLAFTHTGYSEYATLGFVLVLSVPLWCPPVARHFNMEPLMFDFFKKPDYNKADNVYSLPLPKTVPLVPYIEPPKGKEHYRVGFDDQGMTTLTLMADHGATMTLSMNQESCEHLISMLRASYQQQET